MKYLIEHLHTNNDMYMWNQVIFTVGIYYALQKNQRNNLQAHGYTEVALHPGKISRVSYLFIHKEKACND